MRRFRFLPPSRTLRVLTALAVLVAGVAAGKMLITPRLPEAGILVVDLRHALPDKTRPAPDGRRSVSAVDVLRALDGARHDGRITGAYLRVGGGGMPLAQATELADAVLRLRISGKFAVVWSGGFTAANLGDRVLAAAADEVWISPAWQSGQKNAAALFAPRPEELQSPPFEAAQAALWRALLTQAARRIARSAQDVSGSVDAVARAGGPLPPQIRRGPEARAEQAALAWGGADAQFVDLLTYRDELDGRRGGRPVIALVQAEGVVDLLEGSGTTELAGPLAERIRMAAKEDRVEAVIVRISAVAASGEALALLTRAAEDARRAGKRVGFSFGPLVPAEAATLEADMPVLAANGALLVNPPPGAATAALAEGTRSPWLTGFDEEARVPAAEAAFLESGAALTAIGLAPEITSGLPQEHANPLSALRNGAGRLDAAMWQGGVGSLLELKDRLSGANGPGMRALHLTPYGERTSVLERTKSRFVALWRWMSGQTQKGLRALRTASGREHARAPSGESK